MQQRQNSHVEVSMSQSNNTEISPIVLLKKISGILQRNLNSASESHTGVSKVFTVSAELNKGNNSDAENRTSGCGNTSIAENQCDATESSQAPILHEKELNPDGCMYTSMSNEKLIPENADDSQLNQVSVVPEEELYLLEQNVTPDAGGCTLSGEKQIPQCRVQSSQFNQVSIIAKMDLDGLESEQSPDTGRNASALCGKGGSDLIELEKSLFHLQSANTSISTSSSDQEKMTYSTKPEKTVYKLQPRRNPDSGVHILQSEQEITSSRIREKALDDGYNWRKYGQKLVKGNVFVRSYYKCTFSNCLAKKQMERSHDGHLTDIKYIGRHEHPKTQSPQTPAFVPPLQVCEADMPTVSEEISQPIEPAQTPKELTATGSNNSILSSVSRLQNTRGDDDDDSSPSPKRQRETARIDDNQVKKTFCESRQVVQMMSDVKIVNDGYRWRKYGQKLVKGNPNPRSYYRCSNAGCTVKKHVERASHDPKVIISTYEGSHDHDMPASRAVAKGGAESDVNGTTMNSERSELGEQNPVGVEWAVHIGAN